MGQEFGPFQNLEIHHTLLSPLVTRFQLTDCDSRFKIILIVLRNVFDGFNEILESVFNSPSQFWSIVLRNKLHGKRTLLAVMSFDLTFILYVNSRLKPFKHQPPQNGQTHSNNSSPNSRL